MKTLVLATALCCVAMAQSMVGTPDATIEGSPRNPTMKNQSAKTIVATLLVIERADGSHLRLTKIHKAGVAPGGTALVGMSPHAHTERPESEPAIISSTLHAVMFSDGEIRGDDPTGKFQSTATKGLAEVRERTARWEARQFRPEGYYTYLRQFDVYHSACSVNCIFTDPYGTGSPGSPLIGIFAGCPSGHAKVNAGIAFQAAPESGALDPWWSGNAGDDSTIGGELFSRGSCGDYAYSDYGEWSYQNDCDAPGDIHLVDTTYGIC